jgi:hypothetical protein
VARTSAGIAFMSPLDRLTPLRPDKGETKQEIKHETKAELPA